MCTASQPALQWMWPGDVDGPGCGMDVSKGLPDGTEAQTDASNASNRAGTNRLSHTDGAGTYLGVGDVKHPVLETDGIGCHMDASTGKMDASSIKMDARIPINETEIIRTHQKMSETQNSPVMHETVTPEHMEPATLLVHYSAIATDHGYTLLEG